MLVAVLFVGATAQALTLKTEDSNYVAKEEVIASSLYTAGSTITIDGKVQGDVICAGQSVVINGVVDGDVICAAQSITINGAVNGSVRVAGNSIVINGKVARTVMAAGATVTLAPSASIGWDLLVGSANLEVRGTVGRDFDGAGSKVLIGGNIGRNVWLALDEGDSKKENKVADKSALTLTKDANVNGNLSYKGKRDATIEEGAVIKGTVTRDETIMGSSKESSSKNLWGKLISIFSALIVGLLLTTWLRRPMVEMTNRFLVEPWKAMGWGLVVLILAPIISIILMVTIIGIPLGLLLLAAWLMSLYISGVISGVAIGRFLMKKFRKPEAPEASLFWCMVVGVAFLWIISSLPVVGWLICLLSLLWGLGSIWQYGRAKS